MVDCDDTQKREQSTIMALNKSKKRAYDDLNLDQFQKSNNTIVPCLDVLPFQEWKKLHPLSKASLPANTMVRNMDLIGGQISLPCDQYCGPRNHIIVPFDSEYLKEVKIAVSKQINQPCLDSLVMEYIGTKETTLCLFMHPFVDVLQADGTYEVQQVINTELFIPGVQKPKEDAPDSEKVRYNQLLKTQGQISHLYVLPQRATYYDLDHESPCVLPHQVFPLNSKTKPSIPIKAIDMGKLNLALYRIDFNDPNLHKAWTPAYLFPFTFEGVVKFRVFYHSHNNDWNYDSSYYRGYDDDDPWKEKIISAGFIPWLCAPFGTFTRLSKETVRLFQEPIFKPYEIIE